MYWSDNLLSTYSTFKSLGKSLHGYMYECSQNRRFPLRAWSALAERGFMSAIVDKGLHEGIEWMSAALNGFVEGSQDAAFCISPVCHASMGVRVLQEKGSALLQDKYLEDAAKGRKIIAFASTEADSGGTDAYNPGTTLSVTRQGNFLNGRKWHITNAGFADLLLVWAKEEETGKLLAVVVEKTFPGVVIHQACRPGGARTSPVAPFELNNVKIPDENIIRISHVEHYLTSVLVAERILSAFPTLALMRLCINKCFAFTRERRVNGDQLLVNKQNIKDSLSEMDMIFELSASYAQSSMDTFVSGGSALKQSSVLKVMSVRNTINVILEAIKVCASYGLQDEAQFCQALLDCVSVTAGGGTEFAHKEVIFGQLKREHKTCTSLWVNGETPWVPSPATVDIAAQGGGGFSEHVVGLPQYIYTPRDISEPIMVNPATNRQPEGVF